MRSKGQGHTYALIDYVDDYVQPLIMSAMQSLLPPGSYTLLKPPATWSSSSPDISLADLVPEPNAKILQIMPYESLDFDYAMSHPDTCLINSYIIRKALIRKHFLSATVDNWVAKHPDSVLKTHVKRSEAFEVDFAEFLDDALVEAWDLRESMERNAAAAAEQGGAQAETTEWWILKPGMSDRGQGLRLFSTMEQLQDIFDEWEVDSEDEEEEEDEDEDADGGDDNRKQGGGVGNGTDDDDDDDEDTGKDKDNIMASHLRHFVAQPYIHPPLLIPELGNRKFHIRVYVLCVGSMRVYVYRDMLALFAATPYQPPSLDPSALGAHLTNTCLQTAEGGTAAAADGKQPSDPAHRFWDLPLAADVKSSIWSQIRAVAAELFEAAARAMTVHFQPLPQAFEAYGLDFLVDAAGTAWLLEVNAFPDFAQTGAGLRAVVEGFWSGVVRKAVRDFVLGQRREEVAGEQGGGGGGGGDADDDDMVLVREVDLGRR